MEFGHRRKRMRKDDSQDQTATGKMLGTDLRVFLEQQKTDTLEALFKEAACCFAVFAALTPVAKHFVLRCLFVDEPLESTTIQQWTVHPTAVPTSTPTTSTPTDTSASTPTPFDAGADAKKLLRKLFILIESDGMVWLNPDFQSGLRVILAGGGKSWVTRTKHIKKKDDAVLHEKATEKWEKILNSIVAASPDDSEAKRSTGLSSEVERVLIKGGRVTKLGFQFLLQERKEQLWFYLFRYVKSFESQGKLAESLTFIFKLCFSQLGADYPVDTCTTHEREVLIPHLRALGLIFQKKGTSTRYYPTPSAISLMRPNTGDSGSKSGRDGFLIVETNFRVYAYNATKLQIDLLKLFIDIRYILPGVTVGIITRSSVRRALLDGITAPQLAYYLQIHAHPRMFDDLQQIGDFKPVPPTVTKQLFLWQAETMRLKTTPGRLYSITSKSEFKSILKFAKEIGVLLWSDNCGAGSNESKYSIIVKTEGHPLIKEHITTVRAAKQEPE
eukprot:m.167501 g.167501  ORF g.167501 m.167501 type:complete len:500 (-) comp31464_c0_seq1:851-2350(-)